MKISPEEQQTRDFDWFCIDEAGQIGHFATAGFKFLPHSVTESAEALETLTTFFEKQSAATSTYIIDQSLSQSTPDPNERYLRSFGEVAKRGLYSFDIGTYAEPDLRYFRVALPEKPLTASDLPGNVHALLQRTKLGGKLLKETAALAYQDTLAM